MQKLMQKLMQNIKECNEIYLDCLIFCLFKDISSIFGEQQKVKPIGNQIINKTIDYIDRKYKNSISVTDIAQNAGCSQQYLNRLFSSFFGVSLSEYLASIRIKVSLSYLKNSYLPIQQISRNVGFRSHQNFAKCFKKIMNITPSEYRTSNIEHYRKCNLTERQKTPDSPDVFKEKTIGKDQ